MSVSSRFSSTISPETACETLITVARSSCSTGVPMVLLGPGSEFSCLSSGYSRRVVAPSRRLPSGDNRAGRFADTVPQSPEPAHRVKSRSQFVGEGLVLDKTICSRRSDRLFVELLSIELAPFQARNLGAHECSAVPKFCGQFSPKPRSACYDPPAPPNAGVAPRLELHRTAPPGQAHHRTGIRIARFASAWSIAVG